jgi:hypothetical protein
MTPTPETTLLAHGLLQDPGAVPLVIGVVGHRDPIAEVLPLLESHLRQQLQQLIRELPHTPLVMLNGLAEGIDTMGARVFLEVVAGDRASRGAQAPHHQLIAALPKTPEQYRDDFETSEALAALEDMMQRCDAVLHPGNCSDLCVPVSPDGQPRSADDPACYGQQGVFLVRNAFLLFAFYDGVDTFLVGGTSQTVAMQKGLIHPLFVSMEEVLNKQEAGMLVVHHTPRRKPGSPQTDPGAISYWPNCNSTAVVIPGPLLAIPKLIEGLNAEIAKPGFEIVDYGEGTYTRLWSLANREAIKNKNEYELLCRILVILGFVLVLLAQLMSFGQGLWWGLLLVAFLLFPRWQERPKQEFISQRCLAECLSVQHLWAATGIDDSAADLFLSRSHSELSWIRTVVRSVRIQLLSLYNRESRHEPEALQKAEQWLQGQVDYLKKTIRILTVKALRWRQVAGILAVTAVIVALLQSLPQTPDTMGAWVVVLLAGFASAIGYRELMGYQDTKERYEISLDQFQRAQEAMSAINPSIEQQSLRSDEREKIVIEAIGREKLDELNHWVSGQLQRVYAPGT